MDSDKTLDLAKWQAYYEGEEKKGEGQPDTRSIIPMFTTIQAAIDAYQGDLLQLTQFQLKEIYRLKKEQEAIGREACRTGFPACNEWQESGWEQEKASREYERWRNMNEWEREEAWQQHRSRAYGIR